MFAFVIGFGLLCQFLSIAFDNRWVACALAFLVLFVVLILPAISAAMTEAGNTWFTINLAYVNPFFAFWEMTDTTGVDYSRWAAQHLILFGAPMWLATSVLWTIIGSLSLLGTLPFVARRAMTSKIIPYEEMVVSA